MPVVTLPRSAPAAEPKLTHATLTFTGAANLGQTGTAATLFTVTGEVEVIRLVPFCTTLLTLDGVPTDGSCALGVTGSTSLFVAATSSLVIDANEFWVDTVPDANGIAIPAALKEIAITDNIILTNAGTDNTDSGVIRFDLIWRPLSANGLVVPA